MDFTYTEYSDHFFALITFSSLIMFKGSNHLEVVVVEEEEKQNLQSLGSFLDNLHIFKLVDPAFGVALPDLAQRLVLVTPLFDILLVDPVHGGLTSLVSRVGQLILEGAQLTLEPLVTLGQGQPIVDGVVDIIVVVPQVTRRVAII